MATIAEMVSDLVNNLIQMVAGDTESICTDAATSTTKDWRDAQIAKAATIGAGAAVIPIAGYFTLAADLIATLRLMHRAATGICHLELGHADEDTFAGVLAVWSNAVTLDSNLASQIAAKGLAKGATAVGGQVGVKLAIKAFSLSTAAIASQKLGTKVAQKVAIKLTKKLTAKAATRWIPILSAVAGGGANWWIVSGVCDAAEEYCRFIKRVS